MGRLRLRGRLLASHLVVVLVGTITLFSTVGLVAPAAFDAAMGHAMGGGATDGSMDAMMTSLIQAAFRDAVGNAMVIAVAASVAAAVIASVLLASRVSVPISRLAAAARRIADGRYAERVAVASPDEIGDLARSFNRMAESLEGTERRRLQLVGDVAHELRTPLTTVDGYLEGLQDGVIPPTEATWALMRGETARLSRLVDDLQQLWRAEAHQLPMALTAVEVPAFMESLVGRFGIAAGERGVELHLAVQERALVMRADRDRLAQVLDNLVSNALRYSPDGGRVTLAASWSDGRIRLSVADEGPGLTVEQRERVFERFYRVDPSRSRALGGSGIGLAIARALIDAMDGRIWVESEGTGRGSTFEIELPAAQT
ncbi:MAG: sensor histidine kinase [Candidatus Limnocylindrales bacterium]